jgi:hypothetical protein
MSNTRNLGQWVSCHVRYARSGALGAARVAEDIDSAGSSGVAGTPTFFVNGRRQYGAYDIDTLSAAVKTAKTQAKLDVPDRPRAGRRQVG